METRKYDTGHQRFRKIKFDGSQVQLEYEKLNRNGEWDEYSFKSRQEPHPDFVKAMGGLASVQVIICELADDDDELDINPETLRHDVRGISLSYGLDDGGDPVTGVTITTLRHLFNSNSPMSINSPHKFNAGHTKHAEEDHLIDAESWDAIMEVCQQAMDYLAGKRKQSELFAETIDEETGEVT